MQTSLTAGRQKIDVTTWARHAAYSFFREFSEPSHGVCLRVDCTASYHYAKRNGLSVFLTLLHRSLAAANRVENFRTRIEEDEVWLYDRIHGGSAVGRDNGVIGFAYYTFDADLAAFVRSASIEVERVRGRNDLERRPEANLIRYSVLPWFDFTSIDHARHFAIADSAPRITFGKITEANARRTMPVSIHVHHALADGLHVAQFVEQFQKLLDAPEE